MMAATVIDVGKLIHVTIAALAAGVGVSTLFALAVLGLARVGEGSRVGRLYTVAYGTLAFVALAGCAAAILYGVISLGQQ